MIRLVLPLVVACGQPSAPVAARPTAPAREHGEPAVATPSTPPPLPAGEAPVIFAIGEPEGSQVKIRVESRGTGRAHVSTELRLERKVGESWEDIGALKLRESCTEEPPPCLELVPGATFEAPPWLATLGDLQCACERCVAAPSGEYRLVARSCAPEGATAHVVPGDPFELRR